MCVSSVDGGDQSLARCASASRRSSSRSRPLLPSVGQSIPRTWLLGDDLSCARCATGATRSRRAGRPSAAPHGATAAANAEALAAGRARQHGERRGGEDDRASRHRRAAYMTMQAAKSRTTRSHYARRGADDAQVLTTRCSCCNQGEIFSSSGIIYLQPDYVTRLLKPLVDHRLGKRSRRASPPPGR